MKEKRKRLVATPAKGFKSLFIKPTPGRNQPCDCGSKKKYKVCCGLRRDEALAKQIVDINKK